MRPLSLTIEGLTSFKATQEVDLSDLDLFVITGPTGAGKSSILDAITFALYGSVARVNAHELRDLISHGSTHMRVRLDFQVDGRRYRVARRMGRSTHEATLERVENGSAVTELDRGGIRAVNRPARGDRRARLQGVHEGGAPAPGGLPRVPHGGRRRAAADPDAAPRPRALRGRRAARPGGGGAARGRSSRPPRAHRVELRGRHGGAARRARGRRPAGARPGRGGRARGGRGQVGRRGGRRGRAVAPRRSRATRARSRAPWRRSGASPPAGATSRRGRGGRPRTSRGPRRAWAPSGRPPRARGRRWSGRPAGRATRRPWRGWTRPRRPTPASGRRWTAFRASSPGRRPAPRRTRRP